jgi:hypothetical protein
VSAAVAISFAPRLRLDSRVIGGMTHEASRGVEAGGVLLGRAEFGSFLVEDFEPVPCERRIGPVYVLMAEDLFGLEETLEWFRDPNVGLSVLGFYRTGDLTPNEHDLDLMSRYFSGGLLLLLDPGEGHDMAVQLFRLRGEALAPASDRASFPLDATAGIVLQEPVDSRPAEAEPLPEPSGERRILTGGSAQETPAPEAGDFGTEAEIPRPIEMRRLAPLPQPARRDQTTEQLRRRPRWWIVAAVAAFTIAGILLGYRSATSRTAPAPVPQRPAAAGSSGAAAPKQAAPAAVHDAVAPAEKPLAPPASPDVKEQVLAAVNNWIVALRSGDPDRIAACYAPELERYFTIHNASVAAVRRSVNESVTRYGAPVVLRISELNIIPLSPTRAIATLRKHWQMGGRKVFAGEEQERLVFTKIRSGWRIASEQETKIYWTQRPR